MSVRQRKDRGTWIVDATIEHPDGRIERIVKTCPAQTRRAAEAYERELRQAVLSGARAREEEQSKRAKAPTLATFVEKTWLPTYPAAANYRPKTRQAVDWALTHVLASLGDRQLEAIGPAAIAELCAELRRKKLSEKSVKLICATLRRVLVIAAEWGALASVPRFPKFKIPERGFDHLTHEEGRALLASVLDEEERALLMFALRTGVRAGEQLALEWGDLDWLRHEVIIRRNRPSGLKAAGPTKNGRVRRIPLTGELEAALKRHRHLRSSLVFCQPSGAPLEMWHLHHRLAAACRRAGLRQVRWHDLRHSFASQAVESGVPLNVVQSWLGHSTITMTMRYAHLAPDAGARWIEALEAPSRNHGATNAEKGS